MKSLAKYYIERIKSEHDNWEKSHKGTGIPGRLLLRAFDPKIVNAILLELKKESFNFSQVGDNEGFIIAIENHDRYSYINEIKNSFAELTKERNRQGDFFCLMFVAETKPTHEQLIRIDQDSILEPSEISIWISEACEVSSNFHNFNEKNKKYLSQFISELTDIKWSAKPFIELDKIAFFIENVIESTIEDGLFWESLGKNCIYLGGINRLGTFTKLESSGNKFKAEFRRLISSTLVEDIDFWNAYYKNNQIEKIEIDKNLENILEKYPTEYNDFCSKINEYFESYFINDISSYEKIKNEIQQLYHSEYPFQEVLKQKKQNTNTGLGKKTLQFLSDEDTEVSEDYRLTLENLDIRANKPNKNELRNFYFNYKNNISKDYLLDNAWLKEISSGKETECYDLIEGIHAVLSKYIYMLPADNKKTIKLSLAKERSKKSLSTKNKDALHFFFNEYRDLEAYWLIFGDNFIIDFPKHFNEEALFSDSRLKGGRISKKNNELTFSISILEGNQDTPVESWNITWQFNSEGFSSIKYKDFIKASELKSFFYKYTLSIDPMYIKSSGYTPTISNKNIFMPISPRKSKGILIDSKNTQDLAFTEKLETLKNHNYISKEVYNQILNKLDNLILIWSDAVNKIISEPLTSNIDNFNDLYVDFIKYLVDQSENQSHFQELIYIFIKYNTLSVKDFEDFEVYLPWSPYSLILKNQKNKIFNDLANLYRNNKLIIGNKDEGVFIKLIKDLESSFGKNLIFKKRESGNYIIDLVCSRMSFGYYEYSPLTNSKNSLSNKEIKNVIISTINKFLETFPYERYHLQVIIDGLTSYEQIFAIYDEILSYSENSDERLTITLMFTSEDKELLDIIYQRICDSLEQSKIDSSIELRIISSIDEIINSEVDILFSFDPLFKTNNPSVNHEQYIVKDNYFSFWEYTTTRKIPSDPIIKKSSFSLNNHVFDQVGAVLHQASMRSVGGDKNSSFCREVAQDYLKTDVTKILKKTNWLVIYDYLLNKDTLNFANKSFNSLPSEKRRILRYIQGEGDKRSLGILTERDTGYLADNLKRNIKEWSIVPYGKEGVLTEIIFDKTNSFSGDALLKSIGQSSYTHDIVGTAGASILIEYFFRDKIKVVDIFWIHLDDYMQWFKSSVEDDAIRALGKVVGYLSDLLGIFITNENNQVTLNIVVCESKFTKGSLEQSIKSTKQLKSTFNLIVSMLKDSKAFDFNYWVGKFFEFVIVNASFNPKDFEFKDLLLLDKDKININVFGISIIMHYDNATTKTQFNKIYPEEVEPLYQLELSSNDTQSVFRSMLDSDEENLNFSIGFVLPPLVLNHSKDLLEDSILKDEITEYKKEKQEYFFNDSNKKYLQEKEFHTLKVADFVESKEVLDNQEFFEKERFFSNNYHTDKSASNLIESCIGFLDKNIFKVETEYIELDEIKLGVRNILRHSNLPSNFVTEIITSNSILIKIKGDVKLSPNKIMAMKDTFLSVAGLYLRNVYAEAGMIVLVFDRKQRETVHFSDLLKSSLEDRRSTIDAGYNNKIILGKNEFENKVCYFKLDGASPHALIGGQTKSGKSILMNNMIIDLIISNHPDKLRLRLFDPKQVEFSSYSNSAHLAHPVVLDKDDAFIKLQEVEMLMNDRYTILRESGLKDIESYNRRNPDLWMSREVVFFDELADWILDEEFKKNAKDIIVRLSSKGRAAGVHLILATQRPSNDVVFPLLRANLDTKIALKVDRDLNSEIILGESGAENLLGYGHGIVKTEGDKINIQVGFTDDIIFNDLVDYVINYWNS